MVTGRTEPVPLGHDEQYGLEAAGVVPGVASVTQQDPLRLLATAATLAETVCVFFT